MPLNLPAVYRQRSNPTPAAKIRLRALMAKMSARAAEDCKRVDRERYEAEQMVVYLRMQRVLNSIKPLT